MNSLTNKANLRNSFKENRKKLSDPHHHPPSSMTLLRLKSGPKNTNQIVLSNYALQVMIDSID